MPCPVHQVKESPNLKNNSELVDSIGVGHKCQKARRSLSFYQINNKKKVFCEFVNSSSSPGQGISKSLKKFRIG
jgi:hypothetical protein